MMSEQVQLAMLVGFGIIVFIGMGIALQSLRQRDARKRDEAERKRIMKAEANTPATHPSDDERELCPQCMARNIPGTHFCTDCGSPLSSHAAIGPFEHLFAQGHVYRRATEQPRKFIVVAGIWLIFGPVAFLAAFLGLFEWQQGNRFGLLLMAVLFSVSLVLIVRSTANYISSRRTTKATDRNAPL